MIYNNNGWYFYMIINEYVGIVKNTYNCSR